MDWEKQDNELRSLMASSDFLPDGENWNAKEGWKKLQQKKHQPKRKSAVIWLRWSAAACVIGLLGTGIWWMQQNNSGEVENEGIAQVKNVKTPVSNERIISAPVEKTLANNVKIQNIKLEGEITATEAPGTRGKTAFHKKKITKIIDLNGSSPSTLESEAAASNFKKESGKNPETAISVTPDYTPPESEAMAQTFAMVPAPKKPIKQRVVHYNQLVGAPSTSPPVFVQSKKQENEWESIVLQGSGNRKDPMFHLKINISSTPKKSL